MRSYIVFLLCVMMLLCAATNPAMADDSIDIMGRWDLKNQDSYYLRFNGDGTFRIGMPRGFREGAYCLLDDGILQLTTKDAKGVVRTTEKKYRLKGDTLEIKDGVKWKKYTRYKADDNK